MQVHMFNLWSNIFHWYIFLELLLFKERLKVYTANAAHVAKSHQKQISVYYDYFIIIQHHHNMIWSKLVTSTLLPTK